jgi:glycosyltransferase involved in cell wall biosynthesis
MARGIHLVSLPHTQTTAAYNNCAFATLTRNFAKMMMSLGHEVVIYSGRDNDAPCTEHVSCITKSDQKRWFNVKGPEDILKERIVHRLYEPSEHWWADWNKRVITQLKKRIQPGEFVCIIGGGVLFEPLIEFAHAAGCIPVEYAIGYAGVSARTFHGFGSSNWQHVVYGLNPPRDPAGRVTWRGQFYDRVIPHYFDTNDFEYREEKGDYLLYLGKLKEDKGVNVAARAAEAAGKRLIVAGQGPTPVEYGEVRNRYIGPEERRELLAGAQGVFVPSLYVEPFGMIAVEALLSGTPIITTPWGGLGEINDDSHSGVVCNTMQDFVNAATIVEDLDAAACRVRGMRYDLHTVKYEYQRWFDDLSGLWGEGWGAVA